MHNFFTSAHLDVMLFDGSGGFIADERCEALNTHSGLLDRAVVSADRIRGKRRWRAHTPQSFSRCIIYACSRVARKSVYCKDEYSSDGTFIQSRLLRGQSSHLPDKVCIVIVISKRTAQEDLIDTQHVASTWRSEAGKN